MTMENGPPEIDADTQSPPKRMRMEASPQVVLEEPSSSTSDSMDNLAHNNVATTSQSDESDGNDISEEATSQRTFRSIHRQSEGMMSWIQSQIVRGIDPRSVLEELLPNVGHIPPDVDPITLWKVIIDILSEPERRNKIPDVNSLSDVVRLIRESKKILVLTGAGVSVSCGIPDFRSRDGIYARLAVDFPDLPDPQAMFDMSYFMQDPRPFFKFAKEIYPGQFLPSHSHRFISQLQRTGRLLRNYTQNIDTLEQVAGITNVLQCHGSFATASCLQCKYQVDSEAIRSDIFNQTVPRCPKCPSQEKLAILKPDIVFFGENLPEKFYDQMSTDQHDADLLLVIGSSLKVRPVALIPTSLPEHVPQILINREPLPHMQFDVELLGNSDTIVGELSRRLGDEFSELAVNCKPLDEITELPNMEENEELSVMSTPDDAKDDECTDEVDSSQTLQDIDTDKIDKKPGKDSEPSQLPLTDNDTDHNDLQLQSSTNVEDSGCVITRERSEVSPTCKAHAASVSDPIEGNSVQRVQKKKEPPLWRSKWKTSISRNLPDGTFYYDGKYRYIFPGAEVTPNQVDDVSSSDESESSGASSTSSHSSDSGDHGPVADVGQLGDVEHHTSESEEAPVGESSEQASIDKENNG